MSRSRTLRPGGKFTPKSVKGLSLWLDGAATQSMYTTDAGPVAAVSSPENVYPESLALWLKADALQRFDDEPDSGEEIVLDLNGRVAAWIDNAVSGHSAASTSSTTRPTYVANALNGKPVIRFDGTHDLFGDLVNYNLSTLSRTVFLVFRLNGAQANNARVFSVANSATADFSANQVIPCLAFQTSSTQVGAYSGAGGHVSTVSGANNYIVYSYTSVATSPTAATLTCRANGGAGTSASANSSDTATRFGIGCAAHDRTAKGNIDVAEIIVYGIALGAEDRASIEKYLASKWGISGVHAPATAASDPVGYWRDQSGNGRHAKQSVAAYRGTVGSHGARGAITLDGTDDHLVLGNLSAAFPSAGEVVVAYALSAVDTSYTVYQTSDNLASDVFGGLTFAGAFRNSRLAGLSLTGPSSVGAHLWGASSQSSGYNLWVEGANALATTADHTGGTNHAIGMRAASPGANQAMTGKLLEVCVFNRVLSSSERRRLNRYLAARWSIALAPQASNADAQSWINRVYANGGTVSASTAEAVNQFCNAIDLAGIRSKFYRLNLFCGTGLNACLVPLYRGQSPGGTQFGNVTDTNVGSGSAAFIEADYVESGATGGLKGNGSSKHLQTGFPANTLSTASRHLSAYEIVRDTTTYKSMMGASDDASGLYYYALQNGAPGTTVIGNFSAQASATNQTTGGHWIVADGGPTSLILWKQGQSVATSTSPTRGTVTSTFGIPVFGNMTVPSLASVGNFTAARLGGYSIGLGMSVTDVGAYYAAMQAFQTALQRNV